MTLSGGVVVWAEKEYQIRGTIVTRSLGWITIKDDRKQLVEFHAELGDQRYQPKVGDQVTVSYISQRDRRGCRFAVKVKKEGDTERPGHTKAKTPATDVAITPNTQASESESFNKSDVTSGAIASAFVQAYSGADVDAVASLYADRVDHTDSGIISNAAVREQAREYFKRWPVRHSRLAGPVKTTPLGTSKQKVIFSASYDASNPQANRSGSGRKAGTIDV